MADEQQTPTRAAPPGPTAPAPAATFRAVPTVALVAVGFLALCLSPIAFQGGFWFLLFLVPVAVAVWVVRSHTRVDEEGFHVHRLVGSRTVAWSDLTGLRLPEKGWVRAVPADGAEVALRGIRIRDLGRVAEASGNRITAPTPAEAEAAAEHARELEAARMRIAKLRELQSVGNDEADEHDADATTTDTDSTATDSTATDSTATDSTATDSTATDGTATDGTTDSADPADSTDSADATDGTGRRDA